VKCARIYEVKTSGAKAERPELMRLVDNARKGDVIIVWKLYRLARSLRQLIDTTVLLNERGVELHSLNNDGERQSWRCISSPLLRIMRSAKLCEVTGPKCHFGLRISGLGLHIIPGYTANRYTPSRLGCQGLADEDPSAQARQAWLRTIERAAHFLQPPVVPMSSFGARPILCKAPHP
jgi:hypothetical protein